MYVSYKQVSYKTKRVQTCTEHLQSCQQETLWKTEINLIAEKTGDLECAARWHAFGLRQN